MGFILKPVQHIQDIFPYRAYRPEKSEPEISVQLWEADFPQTDSLTKSQD